MIENIVQFFIKGGFFMIPIGICSLVSVAFIIERFLALRRANVLQEDLIIAIDELKPGESLDLIHRISSTNRTTLARLVRVSLNHLQWTKSENVEAVQTKARAEVVEMERGLNLFEIITGISPLLGLLGTVSGLVVVFQGLGSGVLSADGTQLARGIAEALNTTVFGLVVAIPSLIAFSYFSKKVEVMTVEMESIVMDLMAKLYSKDEA